ncbi:hypothetical protein [Nonomuraea wenchangensis]|uniref:Virus ReqiPepy6 Gp37-like protein n=1 Tax=Nonomuraea wenchangensis TaxID=568860 RepID=A0A1I0LTS4_9ACTN|nr:hypothetical protein [Nonomuraea wenchangensis]SEU46633.1 hypothetical protein SAMN05421811_127101 [Nonomuraea wenchangensis]
MPFDLRLVAYAPNGARLGILPHPTSLQVSWPLNDVPALKFTYSAHAVGAQLIAQPCEIGVQWSADGTTWTENGDGRFLLLRREGDQLDPSGVWRFDCPSYLWVLKKAVTYAHASIAPVNGQRMYGSPTPNATAGFIMNSLLTEAQARGALFNFGWTFTGTTDSATTTWSQTFGLGIPLGTDVLSVLLTLVDAGLIDIRMTGPRTLSAWRPGTAIFRNLTTVPAPVELAAGRDIRAAPDVGTLEDMASAVYVVGDASFRIERTNIGTPLPWGRWEVGVRQVGVTETSAAALVGDSLLVRGAVERTQRTRELSFTAARWLPLRDYLPGDLIYAPGEAGQRKAMRVRQITLTRTDRGVVGGNLVLDDRLADLELLVRRRVALLARRP